MPRLLGPAHRSDWSDQRGPAGSRVPPTTWEPFDPADEQQSSQRFDDSGEYELVSADAGEYDGSGEYDEPFDELEPIDDSELFDAPQSFDGPGRFDDAEQFDGAGGRLASTAPYDRPAGSPDPYDEPGNVDEPMWTGEFAALGPDGAAPAGDQVDPDGGPGPGAVRAPATLRDALHDLSEGIAVGGEPLPPIVGIDLTADTVDVLLSAPAAAPPPALFTIAPARQAMCWTVKLSGAQPGTQPVPPVPGEVGDLLPGLFTAGATEAGGYLLLDLEAMRVTCCEGPDELTDRVLVTAATELASSHWSGWYDLVLAGCDELDVLGRAEPPR